MGPLSAFGEVVTGSPTPVVQIDSVYGLLATEHESYSANNGSAAVSSGMFTCQTGTSAGGYGVIRSKRVLRYRPGQAAVIRIAAKFTTPVALSQQMVGGVVVEGGLYVGYNGTQFGVMRQTGGKITIYRLTISAGATGTESVTITLNDATFTFNLGSGTAAANATTVAAQSYTGWEAYQNGSTVTFLSTTVGVKGGAYSFTNNTGGGTAAASFAAVQAGVAHTETWTYTSAWNIDRMDGSGPSGQTLDPTKGNVYEISYQWLGFGAIEFKVENAQTGEFQPVHKIRYANANSVPSLANPTLKIGYVAYSLGSTTNLTVQGASAAGFLIGPTTPLKPSRSVSNTKTGVGTSFTNIVSIRVRPELNGNVNLGEAIAMAVSVGVDGTKTAEAQLILNPTFAGTPNWTYVNQTGSAVEYDVSGTTVTGGTTIASQALGRTSSERLDLSRLSVRLSRTDVLCIAVKVSSTTTDASASISWVED